MSDCTNYSFKAVFKTSKLIGTGFHKPQKLRIQCIKVMKQSLKLAEIAGFEPFFWIVAD